MLSNEALNKLLAIVDSADRILDFVADQNDAPIEFASGATRGISDVLSTAAEQARMFDFFPLDPDEIEILTQLATKHGAEDWRAYLQGLIYTAAKRAGLEVEDPIVPTWLARIPRDAKAKK